MSRKTNHSDASSSNEDGTLYKYDDLRSSTSFNSSEISRSSKVPDSGIGTSTTSSCMNHRDASQLVVKKIELLDELKSLLKIKDTPTQSHIDKSSNVNKFDTCSEFDSSVDMIKECGSEKLNTLNLTNSSLITKNNSSKDLNSIKNSEVKTDYDVDFLVSKAIQYIKKLKKNQIKQMNETAQKKENIIQNINGESISPSMSSGSSKDLIASLSYNQNQEMCISILVKTGLIVYVDERLTNLLGQSAKSWIGKRPIDYLYKDDINLLLTKLCELTTKINTGSKNISEIEIESFFLRFKKQPGQNCLGIENELNVTKTSFDDTHPSGLVVNSCDFMPKLIYNCESNEFIAFRVELKADKVELKSCDLDEKSNKNTIIQNPHKQNKLIQQQEHFNLETCILFKLSYPSIAYYKDIDNYTERSFISEHNVNLQITRVENKVTELLGYLPQELETKSFIRFIHPDDLKKIKQIHLDIFDGKERQNHEIYRWRCRNGCYVSVKTNWSWFIHPWKKQIDFIIGKHVVLVDPMNKNIFENSKKHEFSKKMAIQIKNDSSSSTNANNYSNCSSSNIVVSNKSTETISDESNIEKRSLNLSTSKDDLESDYFNKVEKDVVEYISKKIPGMDDATQMLGQDVIKFIKKKNISASYCQEQNRIMKKTKRQFEKYKPLESYKHAFDYPKYFQTKPKQEKSNYRRFYNFNSYHSKYDPKQLRSSSSSNSEYAKIKARFDRKRNKHFHKPMTSKQADEELAMESETEVSKESKISQIEKEKNLNNKKDSLEISNHTPVNNENENLSDQIKFPTFFENYLAKKSFQPSLIKDHHLFTQYMICKYIDDLPNSWSFEDGTAAATGEGTGGQESIIETKIENKGIKRTLEETENFNFSLPENSNKTRKLSSTQNNEINLTKIQLNNNLGDKMVIDYFLNQNECSSLVNDITGEEQNNFKKANSTSSKSHSRIVLIDENDNDEEEETVKMIVLQVPEEISNEISQTKPLDTQANSQFANLKQDPKLINEKFARLTKENLLRHTREQEELYLMDILKKVQKNFSKKISENPQNICAQTPNVFSCNEYEPKMKKAKKIHQILREKNPNSSISSAEIAAQYENELNLGPYSNEINEVDFENPQIYHESFSKKLQSDLALTKETRPIKDLDYNSISNKRKTVEKNEVIPNKNEKFSRDKESTENSSNPSSGSNKNDDLINFWKKCIKQGSTIVKRIKEADGFIKSIKLGLFKKTEIEDLENKNLTPNNDPNTINTNIIHSEHSNEIQIDEIVILKYTKQLKKRLYIIASLLGINTDIGFDDISIDSDKSEIIESYMKKIIQELLSSNNSAYLAQFSSKMLVSLNQIDTNNIELLSCVYEDLKQRFLNQFDKFNKDNKLIFHSSSSGAQLSSTSNNDDESSSQNQPQINTNNISKESKSRDFEYSSHNTNEFDDSSTYLYDSPTSSLESTDISSLQNNKKQINFQKALIKPKSIRSKLSNEEIKTKSIKKSINLEENNFDDGLLCKIMQNYVDLFKKNEEDGDEVLNSHLNKEPKLKNSSCESSKITPEISSRSHETSSEEFKPQNTKRSETNEPKNEDDECFKNLSINIYNDCFKCLSKVSVISNHKNTVQESESD
ncbi:unnamed protein product [Brachionus calyciflorus]|uniref:PAS domain-containing protein n=1 Tax=Brachionus calyciflorus TaxID=104777 RepID=A0A813M6S5_9BILA|nr:unnamed protein product [Brachionus calyciflorus]